MKTKNNLLYLAFLLCFLTLNTNVYGQCNDWIAPSAGGSWGDFNSIFGGAPCDDGSGCSMNEIEAFEVFASEAYRMRNFIAGGTYAFSMCNGPGAGAWIPEFTIYAPSGAIDAFGAGDGDACTITWTASESGEYIVVINEADNCGGGNNTDVANGFPAISCVDGVMCSDTCSSYLQPTSGGFGAFNDSGGAPCDDGSGCTSVSLDFSAFSAEAYSIDNFQAGGEYEFDLCEGDGAGAWIPQFTVIAPSGAIDAYGAGDADVCTITWTASESGTYLIIINEAGFCNGNFGDNTETNGGVPRLTCLGGTVCPMDTCDAGMVTTPLELVVCGTLDSFMIDVSDMVVPESGGIGYGFAPGDGGTGGNGTGFSLTNSSSTVAFTSDLNGILPANNLDPLAGTWMVTPFVYSDTNSTLGTICSRNETPVSVYFNSDLAITVTDVGGGAAEAVVTGGTEPYSYVWSDAAGSTGATLMTTEDGLYMVMVTDDVGCTIMDSVQISISSVSELPEITELSISPNPTSGLLTVNLQLESAQHISIDLFDLTGRKIDNRSFYSQGNRLDFDLTQHSRGMYLLKINVGDDSLITRKVILTD